MAHITRQQQDLAAPGDTAVPLAVQIAKTCASRRCYTSGCLYCPGSIRKL